MFCKVMACLVVAYIVMTYMVMAHIVLAPSQIPTFNGVGLWLAENAQTTLAPLHELPIAIWRSKRRQGWVGPCFSTGVPW